jgi:hypothetical protein
MAAVSTTTFDERALEALPDGAASTAAQRRRALELFRSLPVPSQETEEWRYTDLSDFDLDFAPHSPGRTGTTLDDVPEEILAAAGPIGERAGLLIQHNSTTTIAHLDPAIRAVNEGADVRSTVHFESIDAALHDPTCTRSSRRSGRRSPRCTPPSGRAGRSCWCRRTRRSSCRSRP